MKQYSNSWNYNARKACELGGEKRKKEIYARRNARRTAD